MSALLLGIVLMGLLRPSKPRSTKAIKSWSSVSGVNLKPTQRECPGIPPILPQTHCI